MVRLIVPDVRLLFVQPGSVSVVQSVHVCDCFQNATLMFSTAQELIETRDSLPRTHSACLFGHI